MKVDPPDIALGKGSTERRMVSRYVYRLPTLEPSVTEGLPTESSLYYMRPSTCAHQSDAQNRIRSVLGYLQDGPNTRRS